MLFLFSYFCSVDLIVCIWYNIACTLHSDLLPLKIADFELILRFCRRVQTQSTWSWWGAIRMSWAPFRRTPSTSTVSASRSSSKCLRRGAGSTTRRSSPSGCSRSGRASRVRRTSARPPRRARRSSRSPTCVRSRRSTRRSTSAWPPRSSEGRAKATPSSTDRRSRTSKNALARRFRTTSTWRLWRTTSPRQTRNSMEVNNSSVWSKNLRYLFFFSFYSYFVLFFF